MTELETYISLCQDYAEASKAYYVDSNPIMTDAEFDALQKSIRDILKVNPEFANECNPFAQVQSDHVQGFRKVQRTNPMLSLRDIYTREEVETWWNSVDNCPVSVEAKLDGLSLSLIYKGGKLVQASTRGTGYEGDDVTAQAKNISNIPQDFDSDPDSQFEIRGEVTMPFAAFNAWNEQHPDNRLANPRNAASGALKTLDPTAVIEKGLQFNAYYCIEAGMEKVPQKDYLDTMERIGFDTLPHKPFVAKTLDDIMDAIALVKEQKSDYDMAIDGVVLKVNDISKWAALGNTDKFHKFGIAFKFTHEAFRSKLLRVVWQVADSGRVTPVAEYEPIDMFGTTCQRATLNNLDWIAKNLGELRIGDTLLLTKGGEIIPKITGVEHRPLTAMDTVCPRQWQEDIYEGADKNIITQIGGLVSAPDAIHGKATRREGAYLVVDKPTPTPPKGKDNEVTEPQPSAADPCPTGERAGLGALSGKSILVSGNFGTPARRKELERLVTSNGATLAKSVSLGVDYYLLPDDLDEWKHKAGSKWEKIQTLCHQSRIINQYEFEAMIK